MYSGPCGLRRASLLLCLLHKVLLLCGQTWRRRHRRLIGKGRTIPPLVARTSNTDLVILRAFGLDPAFAQMSSGRFVRRVLVVG